MRHAVSFCAGIAIASGLFFLSSMQTNGPSSPISGDVREFLSHIRMRSIDDGQGGMVRTVLIEGLNVQIVNGLGATATINGAGNLIVGYNEHGNPHGDNRTGSHNIVTGRRNSFLSYGGLVVGSENSIVAPWASISGGVYGTATGEGSSISGGYDNYADGYYASISGGYHNQASGRDAWVAGGDSNQANGDNASVSGGTGNRADGSVSSVSGGLGRIATGVSDWAAGSLYEDD